MREFNVDVSTARTWSEFITAFNQGFIHHVGGDWNGNLDAFNDYLYWPDEHPYRIVIRGWSACEQEVNRHKAPDSRPVLEVIDEIFNDNPDVEVVRA